MTPIPVPGILNTARATGSSTWPMAMHNSARAVAMATSTGRTDKMLGVAAVLGPRIQSGGTLPCNMPNDRGQSGITVLPHPG